MKKRCFHCNCVLTDKNTDDRSFGFLGEMEYNECLSCQDQWDTITRQIQEEPEKINGLEFKAGPIVLVAEFKNGEIIFKQKD